MNIKIIFTILGFIIGIWAGIFFAFLNHSLSLTPDLTETKTDAIVVLTGGSERIDHGLDLFAKGMAKYLFITGVHPDVKLEKIISLWTKPEKLPKCCIVLGHEAVSTFQNAQETRSWIEENNIKSIRLVTSNYHMIRARMEFSNALPDVQIIIHPIEQKDFQRWTARFWKVYLSEYHKSILRFIQQLFEPSQPLENQPS